MGADGTRAFSTDLIAKNTVLKSNAKLLRAYQKS
jgi:hypothetical protein